MEEVRKIERNINAGGTISSLLELSVGGIHIQLSKIAYAKRKRDLRLKMYLKPMHKMI